jgi:hypothetical protein
MFFFVSTDHFHNNTNQMEKLFFDVQKILQRTLNIKSKTT